MTAATHRTSASVTKRVRRESPGGAYIGWQDGERYTVSLTVRADLEDIARQLATRAARSKRGRATAMKGAVRVTVEGTKP